MANPIAGIYALSPFSTQNPTPAQQAEIAAAAIALGTSGFGSVVLASFHVSETGDINFNDTTIASGGKVTNLLDPSLPSLFKAMKSNGKVNTILASFGGGGCFSGQAIGYWDFLHVKNLIAQFPNPAQNPFFLNLQAMFQAYAIDGIDIDLEVYTTPLCQGGFSATYQEFQSTLLAIIQWCMQNDYLSTTAPFEEQNFWAGLLAAAYTQNNNVQPMAWMNLQNAAGSSFQAQSFIQAISAVQTGISNVPGFISAGLQVGSGQSPSQVQSIFASYPGSTAGLLGGWIWNFSSFPVSQSAAFANAIIQGMTATVEATASGA